MNFNQPIRWIRNNPATIMPFSVGLVIGILVMLPLGMTVSDGIAQVLATITTSLLAIGAAVLLWQVQESRKEDQLAAAISTTAIPLLQGMKSTAHAIERAVKLDPIPASEVSSQARELRRTVQETQERMTRFHACFGSLSTMRLLAIINLEIQIDTVSSYAEMVQLRSRGDHIPAGAETLLSKEAIGLRDTGRSMEDDLLILDPRISTPE